MKTLARNIGAGSVNPMTGVEGFRRAPLDTDAPNWGMMAVSAGVLLVILAGGLLLPADGTNFCRRGVTE